MPEIDEARASGQRDLAEADIVEKDERNPGPAAQAALVGAVGEARVEFGEEVDESSVADEVAGLAGEQCYDSDYLRDLVPV